MKGSKKEKAFESKFVSVRIRKDTFIRVKAYKDETRIPMAAFIDDAVDEKLKRLKKKY